MNQANRPVERVVAAIQSLDLDPIKLKLMDPEEGQGWSRDYVDRMELAYKRFLTLMVKFPDQLIAPTKDVDKFWHGHILDTLKYGEDCQNVFGYFLHHFPYFGMRGEEDAANLRAASANMHAIYEREFGEALPSNAAFCGAARPAVKADSAFCGATRPAVKADSAFCGAARPAVKADSAFCGAARPSMKSDSAFCGAARPAVNADSAFCGAARPSMKSDSAFCGAARPAVKADSAFCGAARPSMKSDSAFCGAAKPSQGRLNVTVRPTLAPAG